MGCGGSSGASDPSAEKVNWGDAAIDDEFKEEQKRAGAKKKTFDKKTGKAIEKEKVQVDREFDFFEGADAGSGEQFMAVRPYEGAIMEPTQHNEPSNTPPEVTYELEYVYGYRAEDSRMNCFYNKNGNVCYFTAALGVILDQDKNTQKFFGGGQTDNTSKQVARDDLYHTNDITAMDTSNCRTLCATGQNGSVPVAFVWDAATGAKKGRYKLDKGGREVTAIAIDPSKKYVALCANDNDHQLYIFDLEKGTQVKKDKSGPDRIFHMAWSLKDGDSIVATAGEKHFAIWDLGADSFKKKKGIYGDKGKATSHS
jgi:microtubule-associated protein-like 6